MYLQFYRLLYLRFTLRSTARHPPASFTFYSLSSFISPLLSITSVVVSFLRFARGAYLPTQRHRMSYFSIDSMSALVTATPLQWARRRKSAMVVLVETTRFERMKSIASSARQRTSRQLYSVLRNLQDQGVVGGISKCYNHAITSSFIV